MKTTKMILARIWWLGRGTATVMGLAVMLAVVLGVGTTALAAVPGDPFKLGKVNTINKLTTLVGNVDGPVLTVKNSNEPFIRTFRNVPLSLETRPDAGGLRPAPMRVDSDTLVQQLNADLLDGKGAADFASATNGKANDADKLDGKDSTAFLPSKTYTKAGNSANHEFNVSEIVRASCDPGDLALSGGYDLAFAGGDSIRGERTEGSAYQVEFVGTGFISTNVTCSDLPPTR